ncbi:TB2/DP1, HVA22 family-domain-containing protein [Auriculariales sp. MPI-PUGE-AT-0066]|nr:TB2/DP1, HVA22 family-domain-containing protein [Auriculariales sp. MPI-PUGE-AT-0066]
MIFELFWRSIQSAISLLYPTYASYKALCRRPADERELERWLMYWSVMGIIVTVEYVGEWAIRWIPLYSVLKLIFLTYLAVPSGEGAAYLYIMHLQPLLSQHESQIDSLYTNVRERATGFIIEKLREVLRLVGVQWDPAASSRASQMAPPPPPAGRVAQMAQGLWGRFGTNLVADAGDFLQSARALRAAQEARLNTPRESESGPPPQVSLRPVRTASGSSGIYNREDSASVLQRRRELEAELAALPSPPSGFARGSRTSSSSSFVGVGAGRRAPPSESESSSGETTRFEEVSYDMDASGDESVTGPSGLATPARRSRPGSERRQSWWKWAAGGNSDGYQPLHNKDD